MDPRELNALIAGVTNLLFTSLPKREFFCLSVILSELSKSMFTMEVLREVCRNPDTSCKLQDTREDGGS